MPSGGVGEKKELCISGHHPHDRHTQIFIYVQTGEGSLRVRNNFAEETEKMISFHVCPASARETLSRGFCRNDNDFSYFPPHTTSENNRKKMEQPKKKSF